MHPFKIEIDDIYSLIEINENIYEIIDEKINETTYPNNYYLIVDKKQKMLTIIKIITLITIITIITAMTVIKIRTMRTRITIITIVTSKK